MSQSLLLVGASGLAREVLAAGITGVVGILDDNDDLHGTQIGGIDVIGGIDDAAAHAGQLLVCVGPSTARQNVVRRLTAQGADRFANFIAPSARVGTTSTVGPGSIVLDGVVITADATVGQHVVIMPNCTITHDDRLDDFATLAAGVALGGGVRVRESAYLGMNASVHPGLTIGKAATIGMGAAVISDVPDNQIWAGVPARVLGETA